MTDEFDRDQATHRPAAAQQERSFLRRWSRRKGEAEAGMQTDAAETEIRAAEPEPVAEGSEQPTDADMPAIESLGEGSDYRGFLSPRVSESLRRAALRKLFQSPRFDVRDGLDDYDGDYTRYTRLGDTVTAHAKFHTERLRERAASREEASTAGNESRPQEERATADGAAASRGEDDGGQPDTGAEGATGDDQR